MEPGLDGVQDIGAHLRQVFGAVVLAAQPAGSTRRSPRRGNRSRGFGQAKCGYLWTHGPIRAFAFAAQTFDGLQRRIAIAVGPAGDDQRGNLEAVRNPREIEPCCQNSSRR